MDEHVHRAVTRALRARGIDVVTAQEDGKEGSSDAELLERSTELGRVLFTQDSDFLVEGARRQRAGVPFGGIIYGRQDFTVRRCIDSLELIAATHEAEEYENRVEYLPL